MFEVDNSSSALVDNNKKYIFVPGEGPTKWLEDTVIIAEATYPISFTRSGKRFASAL